MTKKFILCADNLGSSKAANQAIIEAFEVGLLKSSTTKANAEFFNDVAQVVSKCPDLAIGLELNLSNGKSICTDLMKLTDDNLNFKNSFIQLLIKAYNPKEEDFLSEVEREFRRQIEKTLSIAQITHLTLNFQDYIIPKFFELVCRLANEYKIKYIRTPYEKIYFISNLKKNSLIKYFVNLTKNLFLLLIKIFYKRYLAKYDLSTNDYTIGILYNSELNPSILAKALSAIKTETHIVETVIYPRRYEEGFVDNYFDEFLLAKNKKLKDKLKDLNYEITNYAEKNA